MAVVLPPLAPECLDEGLLFIEGRRPVEYALVLLAGQLDVKQSMLVSFIVALALSHALFK